MTPSHSARMKLRSLHADALEDVPADRDQSIGVAGLRRALERAVEEDRPQVAVVSGVRGDLVVDEGLDVVWEHAQYVSAYQGSMPGTSFPQPDRVATTGSVGAGATRRSTR